MLNQSTCGKKLTEVLDKNYIEKIMQKGIEWLWSARSKDFGWGMAAGRSIHLSGCSETMFGMLKAGVDPESSQFKQSLSFVKNELQKSPDVSHLRSEQIKSARALTWSLIMLGEIGDPVESPLIQSLLKELKRVYVKDEGWSAEVGGTANVYDTALVIWGLSKWREKCREIIEESMEWLIEAQNEDGGWGFEKCDEKSNPSCTSIAAIVSLELRGKSKETENAVKWLISNQGEEGGWEIVFEPLAIHRGERWIHYSTPYAVRALIRAGFSLHSKEVSLGINAICRDQEKNTGGWKILKEYPPFTHATVHALVTLGEIHEKM